MPAHLMTKKVTYMTYICNTAVNDDGENTNPLHWTWNAPTFDDFDADADGVMLPKPIATLDLSHALSIVTGNQEPMMANYRVCDLQVAIVPVDGILDDNNKSDFFAGLVRYYETNDRRKGALRLGRSVNKKIRDASVDAATSLLGQSVPAYQGFRFNMSAQDSEVAYATSEKIVGWAQEEWSMYSLFGALNIRMGTPNEVNSLWQSRSGGQSYFPWSSQCTNYSTATDDSGQQADYRGSGNLICANSHIDVCGGLMQISVDYSSAGGSAAWVDDDYYLSVTIGIEGRPEEF